MEEIDDDLDEQGIVFVKLDDEVAKTNKHTHNKQSNKETEQANKQTKVTDLGEQRRSSVALLHRNYFLECTKKAPKRLASKMSLNVNINTKVLLNVKSNVLQTAFKY